MLKEGVYLNEATFEVNLNSAIRKIFPFNGALAIIHQKII